MRYLFEHLGVAVFAITGVLAAKNKRVDLFGVIVLALVTALGGGTLRDLILRTDPFWMSDTSFVLTASATAAVTFVVARCWEPPASLVARSRCMRTRALYHAGNRESADFLCIEHRGGRARRDNGCGWRHDSRRFNGRSSARVARGNLPLRDGSTLRGCGLCHSRRRLFHRGWQSSPPPLPLLSACGWPQFDGDYVFPNFGCARSSDVVVTSSSYRPWAMYARAYLLARLGTAFLRAIPRALRRRSRTHDHVLSRKKIIQVERLGYHREIAGWCARPLFTRPIPVELDAIAVGIAQVKSFAHAVIRCTIQRNAGTHESSQRIGQFGARRICDRKMIQSGRAQKAAVYRRRSPKCSNRCGDGNRPQIRMPLLSRNAALVQIRGHRDKRRARAQDQRPLSGRDRFGRQDESTWASA